MSIFSVAGLSKRFGRRQVVSGVNLRVEAGEVVGLLGANGAGKSTTFRMVVGLLKPEAGSITFRDRDITRLPMDARARLGMGYLAQEPTVFAQLSVADNDLRVRKLLLQVEQVFEGRGSKPGYPVGPEDERLRREVPGVDSQLRGKDRLLGRVVRTKLFGVEQVWVKKNTQSFAIHE